MTVADAMAAIAKDRIFHETSQGGVTFSGGEPLMQPEFLEGLLEACRQQGLHTVIDTSGHAPYEMLERLRDRVDLFFYDLKLMDDNKHREMTGVSNKLILENLNKLARTGSKVQIRIPLIPEINTTREEIAAMADFISSLPGIEEISLLPYHKMGVQKYINLNRPQFNPEAPAPSEETLRDIQTHFEQHGFSVQIGG